MYHASKNLLLAGGVAAVLAVAGCVPAGLVDYDVNEGMIDLATARNMIAAGGAGGGGSSSGGAFQSRYLASSYRQQAQSDERSGALHHLHIGLAALAEGDKQLAAQAFDAALLIIEAIYGGDAVAQKARANYNAESDKVFRGEPYERAMAYYYRGILYLMEDDYENARASFRSAFLQDSLAGSEIYQQDFAMLAFLEGWASQCNGDTGLAKEAFAVAQKYNANLNLPAESADVLILAEQGGAPVKYTEGEHNELLKIKAGGGNSEGAFYAQESSGEHKKLPNTESVSYQATTRGGREFDAILKGQVRFKQGAETTAEIASTVGSIAKVAGDTMLQSGLLDEATDAIGLGLAADLFSLFKQSQADKTDPTADTRQWDNLPDRVHYGAYHAGELSEDGVRYGGFALDESGDSARAVFQPAERGQTIQRGGEACEVVWTRFGGYYQVAGADAQPGSAPDLGFMEKLNGCWEHTFAGELIAGRYTQEYKVIGPNSFLVRSAVQPASMAELDQKVGRDPTRNIHVMNYRAEGYDAFTHWWNEENYEYRSMTRFVNDNTLQFTWADPSVTKRLGPNPSRYKTSPAACGGLLLQ